MKKVLKNASFRVINFKNFRGEVFRPPLPLNYPAAYLFVGSYIKKTGKKALKMHIFGL